MQVWENDRSEICARIEQNPGLLKILLKTKDDPFFLNRWIRHHAKIVGLNQLIIFDNLSTNEEVLKTYGIIASDVQIVRFSGLHNAVHDMARYPELYMALSTSCEYFMFLDTDEFLVHIDGARYHEAISLLHFIESNRDVDVFPATWLLNMTSSDTKFWVGPLPDRLMEGLQWGKPIIRSRLPISGFINHNIQLDKSVYRSRIVTNFFVLHMVQLSARQRITTNLHKLVARGFISPDESAERVAERDVSNVTDRNIKLYVSEIQRMLPTLDGPEVGGGELAAGCLELQRDGSIYYFSDSERGQMMSFLSNSDRIAQRALALDE